MEILENEEFEQLEEAQKHEEMISVLREIAVSSSESQGSLENKFMVIASGIEKIVQKNDPAIEGLLKEVSSGFKGLEKEIKRVLEAKNSEMVFEIQRDSKGLISKIVKKREV